MSSEPNAEEGEKALQTFLQEIRIVVPGAQVLGAFLLSVPFQSRFEVLSPEQRIVFIGIFVATIFALVLFLAPAVYHRLAWPIHAKQKFVAMGTRFLIAGFVLLMASLTLSIYLVTSLVLGTAAGIAFAAAGLAVMGTTWWLFPRWRIHDRMPDPR